MLHQRLRQRPCDTGFAAALHLAGGVADLGAVHLHCLGAVIELQGQGEWLDHRLVNDGL